MNAKTTSRGVQLSRARFTSFHAIAAGGLLLWGLGTATSRAADTILHSFAGGTSDGSKPYGSLMLSGSKLYGMTYRGGGNNLGTAFSMNTDGSGYSLLHTFTGGTSDGSEPFDSLTFSGGKLYGLTSRGGGSNLGTLFSMNPDGSGFGLVHTFTGGVNDGSGPWGSLTLAGGKLYGMTTTGGGSEDSGTIFSMNADGTGYGLLHSFSDIAEEGGFPEGAVTVSGTKLYGMTSGGGTPAPGDDSAYGTIFSMNTDGSGFSVLHSFALLPGDGTGPHGSLTLSGTKLYGMAQGNGIDGSTIFSINTDGTGFGQLHGFTGSANDGAHAFGSLTLSGSTLFYGMTIGGGISNIGTIFSINTDGSDFGLIESFSGAPSDAGQPQQSSLTLSGDGLTLYGMTFSGGTNDLGVVFSHPAVPEPGNVALLLGGGALLAARRRHKAQA